MNAYELFATLFYAALALFALKRSWKHPGRRQVGVVLVLAWIASNVIFWTLGPDWRPQLFSIIEILFALTCAKAGKETDSRVVIPLIALSILAICANTAYSFDLTHTDGQTNAYEFALNVIFAAQCLIIGFWGAADEFLRAGRLHNGAPVRGSPVQSPFGSKKDR